MIHEIKDFPGYGVSRDGKVYSLNYRMRAGEVRELSYAILDGYVTCALYKNNKQYRKLVHRIVAETFIPNPENKPEVNHKNLIRGNCHVDNLEWATPLENVQHSFRVGDRRATERQREAWRMINKNMDRRSKAINSSIFTFDEAQEIKDIYAVGEISMRQLAKIKNVSQPTICRIVNEQIVIGGRQL